MTPVAGDGHNNSKASDLRPTSDPVQGPDAGTNVSQAGGAVNLIRTHSSESTVSPSTTRGETRPRLRLSAPQKIREKKPQPAPVSVGSPDLMYGGDTSSSTVSEQLSKIDAADNRRSTRRRSVLWPAKLIVGRHEFACQIWNLSLGGARVRIDLPLKDGAAVSLKTPSREPLDAFIVWGEGDSLGLQFVDDPEKVRDHFIDRLHVLGLE